MLICFYRVTRSLCEALSVHLVFSSLSSPLQQLYCCLISPLHSSCPLLSPVPFSSSIKEESVYADQNLPKSVSFVSVLSVHQPMMVT